MMHEDFTTIRDIETGGLVGTVPAIFGESADRLPELIDAAIDADLAATLPFREFGQPVADPATVIEQLFAECAASEDEGLSQLAGELSASIPLLVQTLEPITDTNGNVVGYCVDNEITS